MLTLVEMEKTRDCVELYVNMENVLYFLNVSQRTLTEEWREIFRVKLNQHGS